MPVKLLALVSLALAALAAPVQAAPASPVLCDPALYGAFPDDGLDDTAGLQAAVDAGCVFLREGVYEVRRVAAKKASVVISRPGTVFVGQGARRSWLRMVGPGAMGDWVGLKVACKLIPNPAGGQMCDPAATPEGVELRDFGWDNSLMYDTEEQTHAMQFGPGFREVHASGIYCWHPIRYKPLGGIEGGGDCLRVAGETWAPGHGWSLRDSYLDFYDRSGVAIQRATFSGLIERVLFLKGTDNDIDGEITGQGDVVDLVIRGCTFRRGIGIPGSSASAYSISLVAGNNAGTLRNIQILGNTLDRGIELFDVKGLIARDNVIEHLAPSVEATVEVRRSSRIRLVDNQVTRRGFAGPVLRVFYQNTGYSALVSWVGGLLRQETDASVVIMESCEKCEVREADLQYTGPAGSGTGSLARYGIRARGTTRPLIGLRMTELSVAGPLSSPTWVAPPDVPEAVSIRSAEPLAP